jgi:hypothetical protein
MGGCPKFRWTTTTKFRVAKIAKGKDAFGVSRREGGVCSHGSHNFGAIFFVFSCFYQNLGQKEFFRPKEKEEEKEKAKKKDFNTEYATQ